MSVHVDDLTFQGWIFRGRPVKSCHLWADSLDELFRFAATVNLPLSWMQGRGERGRIPHFDLQASWRRKAIAGGAVPLDRRATVASRKKWRVGGSQFQTGE